MIPNKKETPSVNELIENGVSQETVAKCIRQNLFGVDFDVPFKGTERPQFISLVTGKIYSYECNLKIDKSALINIYFDDELLFTYCDFNMLNSNCIKIVNQLISIYELGLKNKKSE